MFTKILVPTDGSAIARSAAATAVAFARACGSEIVALCVAQPTFLVPSDERANVSAPNAEVDRLMQEADQHVQAVASLAAAAGVRCSTFTLMSDWPGAGIVATAEREQCDLIVMGSHGRRGVALLLAGSETQEVLASANVPVLVLRPDLSDSAHGARIR